jgi:hypothetical protein
VLCRVRPMSRRELEANEGGPSLDSLLQYPEEGLLHFHDAKFEYDQVCIYIKSTHTDTQHPIYTDVYMHMYNIIYYRYLYIDIYSVCGVVKGSTVCGLDLTLSVSCV